MALLAVSESVAFWVPLAFSVVAMIVSTCVTILLFRVHASLEKFNRSEDQALTRESEMRADLKAESEKLHEANTKLIDERMRAFTHDANNAINGVVLNVKALKGELEDAQKMFMQLGSADHTNELKGLQKLEQVKDYVRDHCASKSDVREQVKSVNDRIEKLGDKVEAMGRQVAVLGGKVS